MRCEEFHVRAGRRLLQALLWKIEVHRVSEAGRPNARLKAYKQENSEGDATRGPVKDPACLVSVLSNQKPSAFAPSLEILQTGISHASKEHRAPRLVPVPLFGTLHPRSGRRCPFRFMELLLPNAICEDLINITGKQTGKCKPVR